MPIINKSIFLAALTCPTYGWKLSHDGMGTPSIADQFRMEEGKEVHRRAQALKRQGVFAGSTDKTAALVADPNTATIFEAEFKIDGYVTRADILDRDGDGWHLIEIKSSANDDDSLVNDLSYTAMVLKRDGVPVTRCSLWLLSKEYRLGMDDTDLFVEVDHSDDVEHRITEFEALWDTVRGVIEAGDQPEPRLIWDCRHCSLFQGECVGKGIKNHIFELPRISERKFNELTAMDAITINRIPEDYELTPRQEVIRSVVRSASPYVSSNLRSELAKIIWPAFYLDFETVMTAIPLYADIAPYEQIVTQFSVHVCPAIGQVEKHHEYLADSSRDCRRELAEQLLQDLEGEGNVIVYSSFEKTTLNRLAKLFPDLADQIDKIIGRLYDLEALIRNCFYHPEFQGRTSIKITLPVLVPSMSYDGMDIDGGDLAIAVFAKMARGQISGLDIDKTRTSLLEYCGQDTLAMVRLHEQLSELA